MVVSMFDTTINALIVTTINALMVVSMFALRNPKVRVTGKNGEFFS